MPRQKKETSAAVLGFEDKLWQAAVLMRGKLPATQYRQVLMGLLFLRYVSFGACGSTRFAAHLAGRNSFIALAD